MTNILTTTVGKYEVKVTRTSETNFTVEAGCPGYPKKQLGTFEEAFDYINETRSGVTAASLTHKLYEIMQQAEELKVPQQGFKPGAVYMTQLGSYFLATDENHLLNIGLDESSPHKITNSSKWIKVFDSIDEYAAYLKSHVGGSRRIYTDEELEAAGTNLRRVAGFMKGEKALISTMCWGYTPQGFDYWAERQHTPFAEMSSEDQDFFVQLKEYLERKEEQ